MSHFLSGLECSKDGSVESIRVSLNIAINSHDRIKLKMRAYNMGDDKREQKLYVIELV